MNRPYATEHRTHTCGELRASDAAPPKDGKKPEPVKLAGFVGGRPAPEDTKSFFLRDQHGRTLVRADEKAPTFVHERLAALQPEDVVRVEGAVALRDAKEKDPKLPTGEVVLRAVDLEVMSGSAPLPPGVMTEPQLPQEDRYCYRQLYLRRPEVQERFAFRSRVAHAARDFLVHNGFLEIQTHQLFLYDPVAISGETVPCGQGKSFKLAGGPLALDQYIKAGDFDRFFQFISITTHEDRPGPFHAVEFTGLDINMAYVEVADFTAFIEGLLAHLWRTCLGKELPLPLQRMSWDDAIRRYGTDKPDVRFGCELEDASSGGSIVRTVKVPAEPAKKIDDDGVKKLLADVLATPSDVFEDEKPELTFARAKTGELTVRSSGKNLEAVSLGAGLVRRALGARLQLHEPGAHAACWVLDYPVFEQRGGHWQAKVNTYSALATINDIGIAIKMPDKRNDTRAKAWDLVLDGMEVASAYIGNHDLDLQRVIWQSIHRLQNEDLHRVRAPIEGHRFGVAPGGGMTIGFERLVACMLGLAAIDEVILFPKTGDCRDLFLETPARVPAEAVKDLVLPGGGPDRPEAAEPVDE